MSAYREMPRAESLTLEEELRATAQAAGPDTAKVLRVLEDFEKFCRSEAARGRFYAWRDYDASWSSNDDDDEVVRLLRRKGLCAKVVDRSEGRIHAEWGKPSFWSRLAWWRR